MINQPESDEPKSIEEPVDSLVGCAKILLALASGVALLGWIYLGFFVLTWSGIHGTVGESFYFIYPFIYLPASIYCCWFNTSLRRLYLACLLLNIPFAAISLYATVKNDGLFPAVVCTVFIVLWVFLCIARSYRDVNAA